MTYEEVMTQGEYSSWLGHEDEFNMTSDMKRATKAVNRVFGSKHADWIKRAAGFAFKSFAKLWHVGSMNPKDKRPGSYEGAGLSVSVHPEDWQQIAEIGGDLWEFTKKGNKFVNFHRLTKAQREIVAQWGIQNGYVQHVAGLESHMVRRRA